jgi:hypothetical protein
MYIYILSDLPFLPIIKREQLANKIGSKSLEEAVTSSRRLGQKKSVPPTTCNIFSYTAFNCDFRRNVAVNHVPKAQLRQPEITT